MLLHVHDDSKLVRSACWSAESPSTSAAQFDNSSSWHNHILSIHLAMQTIFALPIYRSSYQSRCCWGSKAADSVQCGEGPGQMWLKAATYHPSIRLYLTPTKIRRIYVLLRQICSNKPVGEMAELVMVRSIQMIVSKHEY
jgi:hypothetical protein